MRRFSTLARRSPGHGQEVEVAAAVGQGALDEVEGRLLVAEALVGVRHGAHDLDVGGLRGEALLQALELPLELVLGPVAALVALELGGLRLVLDALAAVGHAVEVAAGQRRLRRQVLARLERLLVARVGLERALVVLQRPPRLARALHHRAGALQALGVLRCDLGHELVDRARRAQVPGLLQGDAEQEVRLLVERVPVEVALQRPRAGLVLAELVQRLRLAERRRSEHLAEQGTPLLVLVALAQRLAQPGAGLALIGIEVEVLAVELDGEVVVLAPEGLVGLADVLREVQAGAARRKGARRSRRAEWSLPKPPGARRGAKSLFQARRAVNAGRLVPGEQVTPVLGCPLPWPRSFPLI
jgi:hypothetical protein